MCTRADRGAPGRNGPGREAPGEPAVRPIGWIRLISPEGERQREAVLCPRRGALPLSACTRCERLTGLGLQSKTGAATVQCRPFDEGQRRPRDEPALPQFEGSLLCASPDLPLPDLKQLLLERSRGLVIVLDDGFRPLGRVTRASLSPTRKLARRVELARDIMLPPEPIVEASALIAGTGSTQSETPVLVVDEERRLIGVLDPSGAYS